MGFHLPEQAIERAPAVAGVATYARPAKPQALRGLVPCDKARAGIIGPERGPGWKKRGWGDQRRQEKKQYKEKGGGELGEGVDAGASPGEGKARGGRERN